MRLLDFFQKSRDDLTGKFITDVFSRAKYFMSSEPHLPVQGFLPQS